MKISTLVIATALVAFIPLAASAGEVQNRINNEQARINQGVRNGSLTFGEYHSVESRLDRIEAQRNHDLRMNGGKLTGREYAHLNREENNLSSRIYFDKHNVFNQ